MVNRRLRRLTSEGQEHRLNVRPSRIRKRGSKVSHSPLDNPTDHYSSVHDSSHTCKSAQHGRLHCCNRDVGVKWRSVSVFLITLGHLRHTPGLDISRSSPPIVGRHDHLPFVERGLHGIDLRWYPHVTGTPFLLKHKRRQRLRLRGLNLGGGVG